MCTFCTFIHTDARQFCVYKGVVSGMDHLYLLEYWVKLRFASIKADFRLCINTCTRYICMFTEKEIE